MFICGIDPSINGTGVTLMELDSNYEIIDFKIYGYTQTKKWLYKSDKIIVESLPENYQTHPYHHRAKLIFNRFINIFDKCEYISIEDYALNANGNVFDIAEFCGSLKEILYVLGYSIKKLPPTSVKEFATGKGNADKMGMWVGFNRLGFNEHFYKEMDQFPNFGTPHSDMIDSFHMANMLRCELSMLNLGRFPEKHVPDIKYMTESIHKKSKKTKSLPTIEHGFLTSGGFSRTKKTSIVKSEEKKDEDKPKRRVKKNKDQ